MSNSPRYVGKLSPPYLPALLDDSGSPVSLIGFTSTAFSMSLVNIATGIIKICNGTWSIVIDPFDNVTKPSYQWQAGDLDTPGPWLLKVVLHRAEGDLEFDPDLMVVLP